MDFRLTPVRQNPRGSPQQATAHYQAARGRDAANKTVIYSKELPALIVVIVEYEICKNIDAFGGRLVLVGHGARTT